MKWIGSNHLSTNKNVVDVEQNSTTGVDVQCNLTVGVIHLIDLCMLDEWLVLVEVLFNVFTLWCSMKSSVSYFWMCTFVRKCIHYLFSKLILKENYLQWWTMDLVNVEYLHIWRWCSALVTKTTYFSFVYFSFIFKLSLLL